MTKDNNPKLRQFAVRRQPSMISSVSLCLCGRILSAKGELVK